MDAVAALSATIGIEAACDALAVSSATFYRNRPLPGPFAIPESSPPPVVRASPARTLGTEERQRILAVLHEERSQDWAPAAIQAIHPVYQKPELLASAPNQLWSWDITKLRGPVKWNYFQLYVIIDVFSRYVTGWMVAERESAELAKTFIEESIQKHEIPIGQLTIHADRGKVMCSKHVAFLLDDLGVSKTHSRPYVSNDNPYSESQFRTLKYRPGFPDRFGCIQDCRAFCQEFFAWYNDQHCHSGIALLTPAMVHFGQAPAVLAQRQRIMDAAYLAHPERFVRKAPVVNPLPEKVWINKPDSSTTTERKTHSIISPSASKFLTRTGRPGSGEGSRTKRWYS